MTEERITQELAYLAFANPQDYYDPDGDLKPVQHLAPEAAAAISEIGQSTAVADDGETRILSRRYKLGNKLGALEALGKRFESFRDRPAPPADAAALSAAVDARLAEIFGDAIRRRASKTIEGEKSPT